MPYIGRFAPSPTGPLHFGSLVAALASYLDAKANNGQWHLRLEDLDKPREVAGAANSILKTLDGFGFEWDGPVLYQSQLTHRYEAAFNQLKIKNIVYPCTCSRREIAAKASDKGIEGSIYPRTCLNKPPNTQKTPAWRVKTFENKISFEDKVQGNIAHKLSHDIGDFILKRADMFFAYQLAVVVDDADIGVTNVVRGADLLNSTTRQIYLQQLLGYSTPRYLHIPLATNQNGQKLSKQTLAESINPNLSVAYLWQAAHFLGQHPPISLRNDNLASFWAWAIQHWQPVRIPKQRYIFYKTHH